MATGARLGDGASTQGEDTDEYLDDREYANKEPSLRNLDDPELQNTLSAALAQGAGGAGARAAYTATTADITLTAVKTRSGADDSHLFSQPSLTPSVTPSMSNTGDSFWGEEEVEDIPLTRGEEWKKMWSIAWIQVTYPNGKYRQYWDLSQAFILMYLAIVLPVRIGFALISPRGSGLWVMELIFDIYFMLDIWLNFYTPYYDSVGKLVTAPAKIKSFYLKGWFVLDFIATFPTDYLMDIANMGKEDDSKSGSDSIVRLLRILRLFKLSKLLRLARVGRLIKRYEADLYLYLRFIHTLRLLLLMFFLGHMLGCLFYLSSNPDYMSDKEKGDWEKQDARWWVAEGWFDNSKDYCFPREGLDMPVVESPTGYNLTELGCRLHNDTTREQQIWIRNADYVERYVASLYWAFTTTTTVGYGDISATTLLERVMAIVGMLLGGFSFTMLVSNMSKLAAEEGSASTSKKLKLEAVNEYIRYRRFPKVFRTAITQYYERLWSGSAAFNEGELLCNLPPTLRGRLVRFLYWKIVVRLPIFYKLDHFFLSKVCLLIQPTVAVAGDLIIQAGDVEHLMYLMLKGEVELLRGPKVDASSAWYQQSGFMRGKVKVVLQGDNKKANANAFEIDDDGEEVAEASDPEILITQLSGMSYFGEGGVLGYPHRRYSVRALRTCDLGIIHSKDIESLFEDFPYVKAQLLRNLRGRHDQWASGFAADFVDEEEIKAGVKGLVKKAQQAKRDEEMMRSRLSEENGTFRRPSTSRRSSFAGTETPIDSSPAAAPKRVHLSAETITTAGAGGDTPVAPKSADDVQGGSSPKSADDVPGRSQGAAGGTASGVARKMGGGGANWSGKRQSILKMGKIMMQKKKLAQEAQRVLRVSPSEARRLVETDLMGVMTALKASTGGSPDGGDSDEEEAHTMEPPRILTEVVRASLLAQARATEEEMRGRDDPPPDEDWGSEDEEEQEAARLTPEGGALRREHLLKKRSVTRICLGVAKPMDNLRASQYERKRGGPITPRSGLQSLRSTSMGKAVLAKTAEAGGADELEFPERAYDRIAALEEQIHEQKLLLQAMAKQLGVETV